eukprot:gene11060-12318_t
MVNLKHWVRALAAISAATLSQARSLPPVPTTVTRNLPSTMHSFPLPAIRPQREPNKAFGNQSLWNAVGSHSPIIAALVAVAAASASAAQQRQPSATQREWATTPAAVGPPRPATAEEPRPLEGTVATGRTAAPSRPLEGTVATGRTAALSRMVAAQLPRPVASAAFPLVPAAPRTLRRIHHSQHLATTVNPSTLRWRPGNARFVTTARPQRAQFASKMLTKVAVRASESAGAPIESVLANAQPLARTTALRSFAANVREAVGDLRPRELQDNPLLSELITADLTDGMHQLQKLHATLQPRTQSLLDTCAVLLSHSGKTPVTSFASWQGRLPRHVRDAAIVFARMGKPGTTMKKSGGGGNGRHRSLEIETTVRSPISWRPFAQPRCHC